MADRGRGGSTGAPGDPGRGRSGTGGARNASGARKPGGTGQDGRSGARRGARPDRSQSDRVQPDRDRSSRTQSDRGQPAQGRGSRPGGPRGGGGEGRTAGGGDRRQSGSRRDLAGERARRSSDQERYDGPPIPETVTGRELDRSVLAQLRGLPEKLALRVARHLVAAGQLMESDAETAYQHTVAARVRAARVAIVREAAGEAAYAAGHYAEALAELRAARRINGAVDYLAVMADCERALKRPERALELAKSPAVARLTRDQQAEMTIVEAGARADLGELDGALRILEASHLNSASREDWVARLRYAYADLLARAGRRSEAIVWFHRAAGIDAERMTDAAERAEQLEQAGETGHSGRS